MSIISLLTQDGREVEFVDEIIGSGAMKNVYFSPCKQYVVAFYKEPLDSVGRERLEMITGRYRDGIYNNDTGDYWYDLFCWPQSIVEYQGKTGIVVPTYPKHFFFEHGSINNDFLAIKGKEKQGKWFASASNQYRFLDEREKGDWLGYLRISLNLARAVRRMHAAGLAHSDLSYKNVLVSPVTGQAIIIDVDGLVVPGKYPPDVVGTPDFIAPEVVSSMHLDKHDNKRALPSIATDRHALAVLIYHYLFLRHPLRGDKVHDLDPQKDESLAMGENALFIEDPEHDDNRIRLNKVKNAELPWKDTKKLPYTIAGPYLSTLFERAFVGALHMPSQRPTADEWENALVKTMDLLLPCSHYQCQQKWHVSDNSKTVKCGFCGGISHHSVPVINFYSQREEGQYISDNHRLVVYSNQSLCTWHTNRLIQPNERLSKKNKLRQGYFALHNEQWYLVNENMPDLFNIKNKQTYPAGSKIRLEEGMQLLMGRATGDRLFHIQIAKGK